MTGADGLVVLALAALAMGAMAGVLVWERAHARRRPTRPQVAAPLAASGDTATEEEPRLMGPLFKYEKPLPVGKATRTCDTCGRVLELTAYSPEGLDRLDYNLAVVSERHDAAHQAVASGDERSLATASWKGPNAP